MKDLFMMIFAVLGIVKLGTKASGGAVSQVTSETMYSMWDLGKPQVASELMKRYGNEGLGLLQWLRLTSNESPVAQDEWSAFEDERTIDNLKIGAVTTASTGAGTPFVFQLSTDRITAGQDFYGREGFIVTIQGTRTQCMITDITINGSDDVDITIVPLDGSDLASATNPGLAVGKELAISNGAWAAGTGSPKSAVKGAIKRGFTAQIFKESIGAEGTQLVNENWVSTNSLNGDEKGWFNPALIQIQYRLSVIEDGAYLMGVENTNAVTPITATGMNNSTNVVKTTKGIMPWISELGSERNYTVGSFAVSDFDSAALHLRTQFAPSDMVSLLTGAELTTEIENVLQDYLGTNQGGADMSRVAREYFAKGSLSPDRNETGLSWAMDIGWSSFKKSGTTFVMATMGAWSDPKLFGTTGYNQVNYGLGLPLTNVKDVKSGHSIQNIASRYRAYNGQNRRYKMWNIVGGGNTLPTGGALQSVNDLDQVNSYLTGHHGFQMMAANWAFAFNPS